MQVFSLSDRVMQKQKDFSRYGLILEQGLITELGNASLLCPFCSVGGKILNELVIDFY